MNTLLTASRVLQPIVDAPVWVVLLLKMTAILLAAWLVHLALQRTKPRWRVFLWRVTAVGLMVLPAVAWLFPALEIRVEQPLTTKQAVHVLTESQAPLANRAVSGSAPIGLSDNLSDTRAAHLLPTSPSEQPDAMSASALPQPKTLTPTPSKSSFVTWPALLLVVWLGGIAVLAFRLSIGHYRIWRMVRIATHPRQWICGGCMRVAEKIGCQTRVEVLQSADISLPFLCGLRRPRLLLPARMCDDSYLKDLPGIFAHELTHVRSHDVLWNVGLQLVSIILWPHPLIWRMRKAHLAACELVCDAASASFVGDVADYCRTLARVAVDACAPLPATGIAMARTSAIGRRLSALKEGVFHLPLRRRNVLCFGLAALLAVAVLGTLQLALATPPAAEPAVGAEKAQQPKPAQKKAKPVEDANSMPKTGSLLVRVVDEAGKPLVGTELNVKFLGHKSNHTTDAEGRATVVVPGPNRLFLSLIAHPDGYPPVRKWWRNDSGNELIPDEFTFTFERGHTIGGVVRNEEGKPIPEAKVHLSISSKKYEQSHMCLALWDSVFPTDAEGRWHLDHVPQKIDSMAVGLEHPDYISVPGPAQISATQQRQVEDRTAVMIMKKGIPVSGTVTDPEGKPVAGATVTLGEWYSPKQPTASTDQEGHYRFASLAPGGTVLTVTRPGLAPALHSINVQPQMKPVDFQLEKGNTLRVRVVDKEGKPITGVFVTPDTWRGRRVLCNVGIRGRTDAEGRWAWTWAPKDAVQTNFGLTGYVNYMSIRGLPLAPQEAEHVVTLYPALTISGRVIDAQTKQPVPSFHVVRGQRQVGNFENNVFWDRHEVVEGKNGQYRLTITQPSLVHLVRIEADGYQPGISREFKSDEGGVTCDFALSKGQNMNVTVRLPDGKPAAGADVCLCPETPGKFINMAMFVKNGRFPYRDMSRPNLKVGPDGRLPIQPQDNGFLLIVVHDQGFAKTTSEELAAKPEIMLQAWARLEGVVRHGTKPVPNAKLDVYPSGSNGGMRWSFLNFQDQTEADAEGKFVFPKLKPGKWRVRLLPVDKSGRSPNEKPVELGPGQTVRVMLGGEGRPVIGRIQWPDGKQPNGDLSHMIAGITPKMPEPPMPPKEVRDQGADAVRAWMKQWQGSDEGKAWQAQIQQRQQSQRIGSADRNGSLRIENVLPGQYELSVMLKANDDSLPWDQPKLLRYSSEISVPDIPGGVSDEPLDLGDVRLVDKTPKKASFASTKPPAPQAEGKKTVGKLLDNLDLLRYVVETNQQNKAKIKTWQGKAGVERRQVYGKEAIGQDYSATVQFVFDRARKSIRWNTTLEKWAKIVQGHDDLQPVPQIINGMMTPEGLYRFGSYESPGNPKNRPLVLTITSGALGNPQEGQLQPQQYDFNPLYYYDLNQRHGDVVGRLARYIGMADDPRMGVVKVIRDGDQVSIDMSMGNMSNRYTLSLSQGCNPIEYKTAWPESSGEYHWTYELRDGVWLPKTWTQAMHQKDGRDEQCKVTFVENVVNQPVEPWAFSLSRLGIHSGDKVQDRRTQPMNQYQYEEDAAGLIDLPDPPPR